MRFEHALALLRRGKVVTRRTWAGHSDQLFLWDGTIDGSPPDIKRVSLLARTKYWAPTREDLLAEDWYDVLNPDETPELPALTPGLFRRILNRVR